MTDRKVKVVFRDAVEVQFEKLEARIAEKKFSRRTIAEHNAIVSLVRFGGIR